MIESPRILRLPIPEEWCSPRLLWAEESYAPRGGLRFASCHELAAPLRRRILLARQTIIDSQQESGFFRCPHPLTPRWIAEFLLCAHWLGLQNDLSLEPLFSACVDRLVESQSSSGRWPADVADVDPGETTFLAYFALKVAGFSATDAAIVSARRSLSAMGDFAHFNGVARGYLALFGQVPFGKRCGRRQTALSHGEEKHWQSLMRQNIYRQLSPSLGVVDFYNLDSVNVEPRRFADIKQKLSQPLKQCWKRFWTQMEFTHKPCTSSQAMSTLGGCREVLYSAMAIAGPTDGVHRSAELQNLLERLQNLSADVDLLAPPDVVYQVACLEALLLSGTPVESVVVAKTAKSLCQASFVQSPADQVAALRAACLLQQVDGHDESLPPPLQILPGEELQQAHFEGSQWIGQLLASIPQRTTAVLVTQQRNGSWNHCPRVTADALIALAGAGHGLEHKDVVGALRFLRRSQLADGAWQSLQESERIATTSAVLIAAQSIGIAASDPLISGGVYWLIAQQFPDGSWAESVSDSSDLPSSENYASLKNTARVILALMRCGYENISAVKLGIDLLIEADLFGKDVGGEEDATIPLAEICDILCTLCHWASVENNEDQRRAPAVRNLTLLSVHD